MDVIRDIASCVNQSINQICIIHAEVAELLQD